ncbi:MAG: hypothetical protein J0H17_21695 [Rhizobiales bacterium]|nr:hypothetical protein [Hyphomicrobiales bacterium]
MTNDGHGQIAFSQNPRRPRRGKFKITRLDAPAGPFPAVSALISAPSSLIPPDVVAAGIEIPKSRVPDAIQVAP